MNSKVMRKESVKFNRFGYDLHLACVCNNLKYITKPFRAYASNLCDLFVVYWATAFCRTANATIPNIFIHLHTLAFATYQMHSSNIDLYNTSHKIKRHILLRQAIVRSKLFLAFLNLKQKEVALLYYYNYLLQW